MLRAAETVQRTDTGRQRRGNEDNSFVRAPVFALADGMGGAAAGEVASRIAVDAFETGLPSRGTSEERLAVVVQRANREIFDRAHADPRLDGMGTTLTAVMLGPENVALAHVGDSRAYRLRGGELIRLTEDHSLVEELVKDGKLTEEEAFDHPQRSIVTRAVGVEPIVEVDTFSYPVRAGDVIMLCSDGLTDMLPEAQVAELLTGAESLERAARRLIEEANRAGGRDNITVVMFRVEDADTDPAPTGAGAGSETMVLTGAEAAAAGLGHSSAEGRPPAAASGPPAPQPHAIRDLARSGVAGAATRLPRARRQGPAPVPAPNQREFGLLGKLVAGVITLAIVLFLIGGAGYLASRQLYFLATDNQGTVVVDRGFPYRFLGLNLYETYYVSGVPAVLIPASRRHALLDHQLHAERSAFTLINDLELGRISG